MREEMPGRPPRLNVQNVQAKLPLIRRHGAGELVAVPAYGTTSTCG
jgi:hypothetical protein